jgi:acyl-CoA dehydrogenase
MNFELNAEHIMIRDSVRDFAEKEIKPIAHELDKKAEFSYELTKKMGEIGLFGMNIPEKYAGQNLDTLSYIIAVEELARVDSSQAATVAAHNSLGIMPLYEYGSEEQKSKYLPPLCTGAGLWGFGLTEPNAGSDSRGTKTTAIKDGDDWIINGSKTFITNASTKISLGSTVQTISDEENGQKIFSTFIIEKDTPGFLAVPMKNKMVWRASDTAELFFDNVRIPKENLLGQEGEGSKIMLHSLDGGRLSIAAMGLGLAQGAFEKALFYSKERKQFGKPISKFQINAFKLADMATKLDLARNYLYKVCRKKDAKLPYTKEAAMAKLYCSEIAREIADEAIQIHGGYGLMKEYDVERFYRDQRLLQIGEGTSEILRLIISKQIGC